MDVPRRQWGNGTDAGGQDMQSRHLRDARVAATAPIENYRLLLAVVSSAVVAAVLSYFVAGAVFPAQSDSESERSALIGVIRSNLGVSCSDFEATVGTADYRLCLEDSRELIYVVREDPDVSFIRLTFGVDDRLRGWEEMSTADPGTWASRGNEKGS